MLNDLTNIVQNGNQFFYQDDDDVVVNFNTPKKSLPVEELTPKNKNKKKIEIEFGKENMDNEEKRELERKKREEMRQKMREDIQRRKMEAMKKKSDLERDDQPTQQSTSIFL